MRQTTLVLGAGSNLSYGFLTGSQLRSAIINGLFDETSDQFKILVERVAHAPTIRGFRDQLMRSGIYTIDAFLARRPELVDIGKAAIAAFLIPSETPENLAKSYSPTDGDLYRYVWNSICDQWDVINDGTLKIVTFNYDRSLEQYLVDAAKATFGWEDLLARETLTRKMPIIHVYGSIGGSGHPNEAYYFSRFRAYEPTFNGDSLLLAAASIKVIPEHRDVNDQVINLARQALFEAETICFLGFGYAKENLRILDVENNFPRDDRGVALHEKDIYGTSIGMTPTEVERASLRIATIPGYLTNTSCEMLLRDRGVLL